MCFTFSKTIHYIDPIMIRHLPFLRLAFTVLLCAGAVRPVAAQQPAPPPANEVTNLPAVVPAERRLVSGDVLTLRVQEQPSLNKDYGIAGDGTIGLGEMGRVKVVQLTLAEAARAIKVYL